MKPALLIQPSNDKLLKLKKSDRKGAEFMLQNSMHMIRVRIADLTQQSIVGEPAVERFFSGHRLSLVQTP